MIIEVDEYKKKVANQDPERSEDFHRESAKLADKDFIEHLKSGKYREVIFMAGGAASGKTEFSTSYLTADDQLIYDGTLKNFDGFQIKLKNIKRYAKNNPSVKVVLITPLDWKSAFEIFLNRERKMENQTFFDTHIRSRLAVSKILAETNIKTEIYFSKVVEDIKRLEFEKADFTDSERIMMADFLKIFALNLRNDSRESNLLRSEDYDNIQEYMKTLTIGGSTLKISQTLVAPNTPVVLAYLKAAKEGKGLAEKVLKNINKSVKK